MFSQLARYRIEVSWLLLLIVLTLLAPRKAFSQNEMGMIQNETGDCDGPPTDCFKVPNGGR